MRGGQGCGDYGDTRQEYMFSCRSTGVVRWSWVPGKVKAQWTAPGRIINPSTTYGHSPPRSRNVALPRQHTTKRCSGTISPREAQHKLLLDGQWSVQIPVLKIGGVQGRQRPSDTPLIVWPNNRRPQQIFESVLKSRCEQSEALDWGQPLMRGGEQGGKKP